MNSILKVTIDELPTPEDILMSDICLRPDEISTENPATPDCTIEDETEMNVSADGFECVRVIGRGGQSVVYEAVCKKSVFEGIKVGSRVALKVLNGYGSDDDLRKFNTLCKRLSRLDCMMHGLVVHHYGCIRVRRGRDLATAIVMDLIVDGLESRGETLYARLCRHPHGLDVDDAVRIIKTLVNILSCLHSIGVVHRDIKPSNIFVGSSLGDTLLDFTSAKWDGDAIEPMAGRGIGTPKYRAPEMKSPDFTGDEKSDIYSVALVLREMLCGNTDNEAGCKSKSCWSGLEKFRHAKPTVNDRIADVGKLSSDLVRIIRRGLSKRFWRYGTCDGLLADLEKIRFPIYEYDNHRYVRLSYERCSGCVANGVAYGKMLDIGTGRVFKWKTFKMDVAKPRKFDDYVSSCPYSLGETRLGLWSWSTKVKANCLQLDLESAFPIRDGKERLLLLVYSRGMDAPRNTLRYQGKVLCAKGLGERQRDAVTKRLFVSDALTAFARYARGVSILHEAGIETVDVAPDILLYEDGHPSSSAITCRRYDCQCVLHRGHAGPGSLPVPQDCWPSDWWQSESRLTFFYSLPNGDRCDAFALGLCLYEVITGRKGYAAPLLDKYGHIINRGNLSIDFDHPILAKHADVADVIRQMTEIDKKRRLCDMRKIEGVLRELAVKYRLVGSEIGAPLKCEGQPNKAAECVSVGLNGCNVDARMSALIPFGFGGNYTKDVDYMSNMLVALRKVTSRKCIVPKMIRKNAEGSFMGILENKERDEYRECSLRSHCDCSEPEVFYFGDPDVT